MANNNKKLFFGKQRTIKISGETNNLVHIYTNENDAKSNNANFAKGVLLNQGANPNSNWQIIGYGRFSGVNQKGFESMENAKVAVSALFNEFLKTSQKTREIEY